MAASYSRTTTRWKYDVFLSFRGEDTRKSFTDHLYTALCHRGVITFRDDQELERGNEISRELLQAIQDSRFSVIVFSRNYTSSTWCLNELVKIVECMKQGRQTVIPVFYDVDPSEVRNQTGRLQQAFADHEEVFKDNIEKVQTWRIAMKLVANLSGWDLQDRHESEFIQGIVEEIVCKLRKSSYSMSWVTENLVGMDWRLEEMSLYFGVEQLNDVRVIGICGMGGIGKTTIARAVYEKMLGHFEGSSFLANVREVEEKHGLVRLQEQLLSDTLMDRRTKISDVHRGMNEIRVRLRSRMVLVVLDDVDQLVQLESLVGDRNWFDNGSRVIITTRDELLLKQFGVDKIYRVASLNNIEAVQLFCLKAFRSYCPPEDYVLQTIQVVKYADGLPLALHVLGSFFSGIRSVELWNHSLKRLKDIPDKGILDKLKISFDGLNEVEKKIFLDIACFFNGWEEDCVTKLMESSGFYPQIGIRILVEKFLINISDNRVWMHDLLQEMGRQIVKRESHEEPGKRTRLWLCEDVIHVLLNNTGTDKVEGIVLNSNDEVDGLYLSAESIMKMKRLRILKLQNINLSQKIKYLSNELRYLEWCGYPFKSLPSTFQPDKLVELHMRHSSIKQLWEGVRPLKLLRAIDLRHSRNLIKTPDFRQVPNLEKLNLEGCRKLVKIHDSIGILKGLVFLNLKDCVKLACLPSNICELKTLRILNLYGCFKLEKLPEMLGNVMNLEELDVGRTAITQLPSTFGLWKKLKVLSLDGCKGPAPKSWYSLFSFRSLPRNPCPITLMLSSLSALYSLTKLNLSNCNLMEGELPDDMSCFPSLEELDLIGNNFVRIPSSISRLSKLKSLRLGNCKKLQSLPDLPSRLEYLGVDGCASLGTLPNLFEECARSKFLSLIFMNCSELTDYQGNISMGLTWLKYYLHFLLESGHQGHPASWFFTCFPGSEIPSWFHHKSVGHSLTIRLLPYEHWSSSKWMGLAVCAFFEELDCGDSCLITLNFDIKGFKSRSYFLEYPEGSTFTSNQVFFIFFPRGKFPEPLAVSNTTSQPIEVEFRSSIQERNTNNEFQVLSARVMNWGFRMVYEEDTVQFNEPNTSVDSINGLHSEELRILDENNSIIPCKNIEGKCLPE